MKMNATASGMSATARMFLRRAKVSSGLGAPGRSGAAVTMQRACRVPSPAKDIDGGLGVLGLRSEGVEGGAFIDLQTFGGWLVK